jgi:hypothetical protein
MAKNTMLETTPRWVWGLLVLVALMVCGPLTLGMLEAVSEAGTPAAKEAEAGETPTAQEIGSYWDRALAAGMRAAEGAQDAELSDEWSEVAKDWSEAIAFLKMIEEGEPQYEAVQGKIAEYEANRDAANQRGLSATNTEAKAAASEPPPIAQLEALIRQVDPDGAVITDVRLWRVDDEFLTAELVVAPGWHYQPKAVRLDAAKVMWQRWAEVRSPDKPDYARIRLTTAGGEMVGGSRAMGSIVYVED